MLVQTYVRYSGVDQLIQTGFENEQEFGTPTIGVDTTVTLAQTSYTNNQEFGFQEIEAVPADELEPSGFENAQEFGTQEIGPDLGLVSDALFLDDDDSEMLINLNDYARYK